MNELHCFEFEGSDFVVRLVLESEHFLDCLFVFEKAKPDAVSVLVFVFRVFTDKEDSVNWTVLREIAFELLLVETQVNFLQEYLAVVAILDLSLEIFACGFEFS